MIRKDSLFYTRKDEEKNVFDQGSEFNKLKIDDLQTLWRIFVLERIVSNHHVVDPEIPVAEGVERTFFVQFEVGEPFLAEFYLLLYPRKEGNNFRDREKFRIECL